MLRRLTLGLMLALGATFPAVAQDADSDGLPDAVEESLGTNPGFAESLDVIVRDKSKGEGDRVGGDNYAPGLDVTAVALGNAGQDRWLWRVDFLDAPVREQLGIILYIQADNDETTGRKDMRGIDYMLSFRNGAAVRAFNPDGTERPESARAAVVGNSLYLCADMKLHQEDGQTKCSAQVLVETLEPYKMVDTVDRFTIAAQGESERRKMVMLQDATDNQGVLMTWDLDIMRALGDDPANVRLPIEDCKTHGFQYDNFTQYHRPSVRVQEGGPFTIETTVPRDGAYHPGFILYDGPERQVFRLSVNGKQIGIAVASENNNRQTLVVAERALDLKEGDLVKVELAANTGFSRVEDLWLLAKLPPIRPLAREVRYLKGEIVADEDGLQIRGRITFVTTWPVKATVEYGATPAYGNTVEEAEAQSNHRVLFSLGIAADETLCFRVTAQTPEGKQIIQTGQCSGTGLTTYVNTARYSRGSLALTVRNDHSVALKAWPVTQGVPFPQGALRSADDLRLVDSAGAEVALAATVTARWPDGSIKWALLDFQGDLPADHATGYALEYGQGVSRREPACAVTLDSTRNGIIVDAGRLKFELPQGNAGFLGRVWLDKNGDGVYDDDEIMADDGLALVGYKGGSAAGLDSEVQVVSCNALRAVLRVTAAVQFAGEAGFSDSYDLHVYLDKPFVRVFHTWVNSNPVSEFSDIQSWDLVMPVLVGSGGVAAMGGAEGELGIADGPAEVDQTLDNRYAIRQGGRELQTGDKAPGWLDLVGDRGGVTVAVRDFWQLYPKRLSASLNAEGNPVLSVGIMPAFAPGTYKISKEGELEDKLFFYLKDDAYRLRQGVSKRHELLYCFRGAGEDRDEALAAVEAFQRPPLAVATKEWYCDSGAFTDTLASSPELGGIYRIYEEQARKSLSEYLKARDQGREYGMLNFGDWWGERGRNWGNIEYDTQHGFYLQFIRSGDPSFFYPGEEACRHNMDVDTVWAHRDPRRIGGVYAHCIGHTGNYYDHMINDQGSPGGGFTVCHTWVEGYLDDYFLTGDIRGLEAARIVADRYNTWFMNNYEYDDGRNSGWHLILTLAMYRATGDPFYLNAAHMVMERVKEREMPEGGWARQLMPGHCMCLPRHRGEAAFMVGILLTGLKDYHEITGDERTASMMVRGARNCIKETWVPEVNGMRYTSCPNTGPSTGLSTLVTEGILYAYGLSGDPELGEVALAGTLQGVLTMGGWGKGFSQQIRVTPHFLHQLRQTRLSETAVTLSAGKPATMLLRCRDKKPFEVVLRPWDGAGRATARLVDPVGQVVTETTLNPVTPSVTLQSGPATSGVYRLELAGEGSWGVDPYLTPLVVQASQGVTLPRRPSAQTYFAAPETQVELIPAAQGKPVAESHDAALPSARELVGYRAAKAASAALKANGKSSVVAPWTQFWFDPGQPTAAVKLTWNPGPGGSGEALLDASGSSDPDGEIAKAEWSLDGGPVGEGMTVKVKLKDEGDHTVGLRVTDDTGLSAQTSVAVRVPPTWVLAADPGRCVVIEAEDFVEQSGGEVRLYERFSSGKMVTYWQANVGHALTWTARVPQAGDYFVALKYCTDTPRTERDLKVDGAHPGPGFERFHLPPTGGFSTGRNNWVYVRIGEQNGGMPLPVRLTAGEHRLSMSNLGDGCGLDQILLVPAK